MSWLNPGYTKITDRIDSLECVRSIKKNTKEDAEELRRVSLGMTDLIGAIECTSLSSHTYVFAFLLETLSLGSLGSSPDGYTQ